jgi:hypothetical protein
LGGGFGRRAAIQEFVRQAVLIAKEVDVPVKLLWSREEDIKHDYYRPFGMARLVAGLGADGMPIAWKVRIAGPSFVHGLVPGFGMSFVDRTFISGLADEMAYDVPNYLVDYVVEQSPVPLGVWRAINYTQNTFYKESFVDEMAHAAGMDPYLYRRHLLRNNAKHLAVLDAAAKKADWFSPLPEGMRRGIAVTEARQCLRASGGSVRRARRSARASRRLGARLRQRSQSAVDRDADGRRCYLRADRGADRRDHHQEWRRRAGELRYLRNAAHCRRTESRDRAGAERQFLGRRGRTAGSAAGAGAVQRDLRGHRQTHPVAADQESRPHQGDLAARAEAIVVALALGKEAGTPTDPI